MGGARIPIPLPTGVKLRTRFPPAGWRRGSPREPVPGRFIVPEREGLVKSICCICKQRPHRDFY